MARGSKPRVSASPWLASPPAVEILDRRVATAQRERLVDPSASTSPSAAGTDLQCALQVLCELARRDAKLLALCRGHPAVEDLDGWRRGEPWRG